MGSPAGSSARLFPVPPEEPAGADVPWADVPWAEARRRAHQAARPLAGFRVPLSAAAGLTLAEPLRARNPLPAFDTAAMDGYAVRGPGPYRLDGEVRAGDRDRTNPLAPGRARAISTGAMVPPGTTAVVRLEDAVVTGDLVTVAGPAAGSRPVPTHIRRAGEEAALGTPMAPAGIPVRPALLGLAAAAGYDRLLVRPRPLVTLIVTGDELKHSGTSGDGLVRDALGPMLAPLISDLGGELVAVRHLPDRPAEPFETALAALAAGNGPGGNGDSGGGGGGGGNSARRDGGGEPIREIPVTVVTGSTSVGRGDRLRPLLRRHGARWVVSSVACRPGHPQLLAGWDDRRWVVGLPGNPFAAFVAAHTLLGPLLAGLSGRALPVLPAATLVGSFHHSPGRTTLVPVRWSDESDDADGESGHGGGGSRTGGSGAGGSGAGGREVGAPVTGAQGGGPRVLAGHQPAFLGAAAGCDALAVVAPDWRPGRTVRLLTVH
jgi:molybdopterin molybdotransferase